MKDEATFSKYDYTTAGTETNMQELLEKAVKESEKKWLLLVRKLNLLLLARESSQDVGYE